MGQTSEFSLEGILQNDRIRHLRPHKVPMLGRKATVGDAVSAMQKTRRSCVLVFRDKDLVGIFTERDVLVKASDNRPETFKTPLEQVMTPNPKTIQINDSILRAIQIMSVQGFRHLAVIEEDGSCVGTVSIRNLLVYLAEHFPQSVYNLPPMSGQINEDRDGA